MHDLDTIARRNAEVAERELAVRYVRAKALAVVDRHRATAARLWPILLALSLALMAA